MIKLAFLFTLGLLPLAAQAETLNLQCVGGGSANKTRTSFSQAYNNSGGSAYGTSQSRVSEGFADQVDLSIMDGDAKIRMPRSMLPPLHGGDGGWMKVKRLEMTDREITGTVAVNPINSPKFRIDRLTGILSMNGKAGSFTGECRAYDPATAPRRF